MVRVIVLTMPMLLLRMTMMVLTDDAILPHH